MALLAALILPCASFGPAAQRRRAVRRRASPAVAPEPSEAESRFGRRSYWDGVYADEAEFSWYCGWADVEPLWLERPMDGMAGVWVLPADFVLYQVRDHDSCRKLDR